MSKAFDKSKNMPIGVSPLSIQDKIPSTSSKDAISVEWPLRKPY